MQKIKLRTEESGKKLSAAYAPPKWSETAEEEESKSLLNCVQFNLLFYLIVRPFFSSLFIGGFFIYSLNIFSFFILFQVVIKDSHQDNNLCGQIGVVRGVIPGHCSVYLHEEERLVIMLYT